MSSCQASGHVPQEHLANEPVLVHRLLVLPFWYLCPHLKVQVSEPSSSRLAATLGAKSSFKKLPKRSVLTADISQLCGLIAEPPEPLALRLSSNLMIGVARCVPVVVVCVSFEAQLMRAVQCIQRCGSRPANGLS